MRDTRRLLTLLELKTWGNWWEILDGCCCCCCSRKAPPGTKTARHGRTNRPQNRTEKVPNVTSENRTEDLRELMRDTRRLLPLLLLPLLLLTEEYQKHLPAPKQQDTEGRTGPRIAPKKCLTWLLEPLLQLKTWGNWWERIDERYT